MSDAEWAKTVYEQLRGHGNEPLGCISCLEAWAADIRAAVERETIERCAVSRETVLLECTRIVSEMSRDAEQSADPERRQRRYAFNEVWHRLSALLLEKR